MAQSTTVQVLPAEQASMFRYAYPITLTYSDGSKVYMHRYYSDFAKLHQCLAATTSNGANLPSIPEKLWNVKDRARKRRRDSFQYLLNWCLLHAAEHPEVLRFFQVSSLSVDHVLVSKKTTEVNLLSARQGYLKVMFLALFWVFAWGAMSYPSEVPLVLHHQPKEDVGMFVTESSMRDEHFVEEEPSATLTSSIDAEPTEFRFSEMQNFSNVHLEVPTISSFTLQSKDVEEEAILHSIVTAVNASGDMLALPVGSASLKELPFNDMTHDEANNNIIVVESEITYVSDTVTISDTNFHIAVAVDDIVIAEVEADSQSVDGALAQQVLAPVMENIEVDADAHSVDGTAPQQVLERHQVDFYFTPMHGFIAFVSLYILVLAHSKYFSAEDDRLPNELVFPEDEVLQPVHEKIQVVSGGEVILSESAPEEKPLVINPPSNDESVEENESDQSQDSLNLTSFNSTDISLLSSSPIAVSMENESKVILEGTSIMFDDEPSMKQTQQLENEPVQFATGTLIGFAATALVFNVLTKARRFV